VTDQTPLPPLVSRRNLFRAGGVVSVAALLAACNDGEKSDAPGRVGYVPPITELPTTEINDAVYLRTGASIEQTAIETIRRMMDESVVDATYNDILERFIADHTAQAEHLNQLVIEAGGEPFTCGNPWLQDRSIDPAFVYILGDEAEGIEPSDDPNRDGTKTLVELENMLAASFQLFVSKLSTAAMRQQMAVIAATDARHGSLLAYTVTGAPEGYINPAMTSTTAEEVTGYTKPFAMSTRFGSLTGITFKLGKEDETGAIPEVTFDTPAENAYVYDYVTC
jgi:hypothetical protein